MNLEKSMEEWSYLITQRYAFVGIENSNNNSYLWVCAKTVIKRSNLTEQFLVHNLKLANVHNSEAIFVKVKLKGKSLPKSC